MVIKITYIHYHIYSLQDINRQTPYSTGNTANKYGSFVRWLY